MKPFKIYAEHLEATALEQFESAMAQPSVVQGALMPDAHTGYTVPIGSVLACDGVVFPSFVGYDIGCGVAAARTTFNLAEVQASSKAVFDQIYRDVPVGFNRNKERVDWVPQSRGVGVSDFVAREIIFKGAPGDQIGTLGGGNHFIEIGHDEDGVVWIIVHSGSRNIGHKIATHYMKIASPNGKASEGFHGLDADSNDGKDYIGDLEFALDFALANRKKIIGRVSNALGLHMAGGLIGDLINRNHNHAELKDGLWIHRKGATHAEEGMLGVIPGNMRDGSFIVRGKGNPDSLFSSSHGAGRVMGRKVAQETLSIDVFKDQMRGVQAKVDVSTLDESPSAYKDIHEVMALQRDLVEVLHHVKPIINIKG